MNKNLIISLILSMLMTFNINLVPVFATEPTTVTSATSATIPTGISEDEQQGIYDIIGEIFSEDLFKTTNVSQGIAMSRPLVGLIMTAVIIAVVLISFLCFLQIILDMGAIMIPVLRGFLVKKKEAHVATGNTGGVSDSFYISDAAYNAIFGAKSGSTYGGYGQPSSAGGGKTTGSILLEYAKSMSVQLVVFFTFIILITTGQVGKVVLLVTQAIVFVIDAAYSAVNL